MHASRAESYPARLIRPVCMADLHKMYRSHKIGAVSRARCHYIYTTVNTTDEFRNVSVTEVGGAGWRGRCTESRPGLETVNKLTAA